MSPKLGMRRPSCWQVGTSLSEPVYNKKGVSSGICWSQTHSHYLGVDLLLGLEKVTFCTEFYLFITEFCGYE